MWRRSFQKVLVCHSSGWGAKNPRPPPEVRYNSSTKASKPWINFISPAFHSFHFFPPCVTCLWIRVHPAFLANVHREARKCSDSSAQKCKASRLKCVKFPPLLSNTLFFCHRWRFDGLNDWNLKGQFQGDKYNLRHSTNRNFVKARLLNKGLSFLTFSPSLLFSFNLTHLQLCHCKQLLKAFKGKSSLSYLVLILNSHW